MLFSYWMCLWIGTWENIEECSLTGLLGKAVSWGYGLQSIKAEKSQHPTYRRAILTHIKWEVRARLLANGHFKSLRNSLSLVYRWNPHTLMSELLILSRWVAVCSRCWVSSAMFSASSGSWLIVGFRLLGFIFSAFLRLQFVCWCIGLFRSLWFCCIPVGIVFQALLECSIWLLFNESFHSSNKKKKVFFCILADIR